MSDSNNDLADLIESTRQDAQAQREKQDSETSMLGRRSHGRQIFAVVLLALSAGVLLYQYPRFAEPYAWPEASLNSSVAEGDLMEVVGLIETYRMSHGKVPEVLSQVNIPEGLTSLISESTLLYQPRDQAYSLDWTFANWHATFESQTQVATVEPVVKH